MAADWSYLPADLAVLVAQRLTVYADHVRFGDACTAWRSATRARDGRPRAFLPYLLRDYPGLNDTVALHSLSGCEILHAPFPKVDGVHLRCIASSNGWLLLGGDDGRMFLFDPLSNSRVDLPSAKLYPGPSIELGCVSSDGSRTVMVSYSCYYDFKCRLAYARPGDERWTPTALRLPHRCDSLYHHEGKFIVVVRTGQVLAIEITPDEYPDLRVEDVAPRVDYSIAPSKFIVFAPSGEMVLLFYASRGAWPKPPAIMTFVLVNGGRGWTEWKRVDAKQVLGDVQVLTNRGSLISIQRSILPFPLSRLMPTLNEWIRFPFPSSMDLQAVPLKSGDDNELAVRVGTRNYMWFQPNYK